MRIQSRRAVWVGVLLVFTGALAGQAQPHLVVDLNQESVDSPTPPSWFGSVEHDGVLYFSASDPPHGYEIWRTDGTPDGTFRLMDLCPGPCSGGVRTLGVFHGFLYFLGDDREHGLEIWRTDGTVGGEELLADVCPGTCGTVPSGWVEWRDGLWFLAQESFDAEAVLWTSDGTAAGTRPVANLCTDLSICRLDPVDDNAFLARPDPSGQGLLLWTFKIDEPGSLFRTDGTAGGTVLLHRFVAGFQFDAPIGRNTAGPLYFLDGLNLWTSDGTPAGTHLVRNLDGLIEVGFLLSTAVVDGIFYATFSDNNWLRSDGTAEGTFVLAQVAPGTDPTIARIGSSVFVLTTDGIWRTAGTPETTSSFAGPLGEILSVVERPDRATTRIKTAPSYGPPTAPRPGRAGSPWVPGRGSMRTRWRRFEKEYWFPGVPVSSCVSTPRVRRGCAISSPETVAPARTSRSSWDTGWCSSPLAASTTRSSSPRTAPPRARPRSARLSEDRRCSTSLARAGEGISIRLGGSGRQTAPAREPGPGGLKPPSA